MRRILLMLTVAALMVTLLVANAATASAQTREQELPQHADKGLSRASEQSKAIEGSGEFGIQGEPVDPDTSIENGNIPGYKVNLAITFVLEE